MSDTLKIEKTLLGYAVTAPGRSGSYEVSRLTARGRAEAYEVVAVFDGRVTLLTPNPVPLEEAKRVCAKHSGLEFPTEEEDAEQDTETATGDAGGGEGPEGGEGAGDPAGNGEGVRGGGSPEGDEEEGAPEDEPREPEA